MRHQTGDEAATRWTTNRRCAVGVRKADPVVDQVVEIWRAQVLIAMGTYRIRVVLIGENDNNVRALRSFIPFFRLSTTTHCESEKQQQRNGYKLSSKCFQERKVIFMNSVFYHDTTS